MRKVRRTVVVNTSQRLLWGQALGFVPLSASAASALSSLRLSRLQQRRNTCNSLFVGPS